VNHGLLTPYPVLQEKPGDFIAHIKFTVLLLPSGNSDYDDECDECDVDDFATI
jgi:methionine aminopeptidase